MIVAYCGKCKKKHEGADFGVLMQNDIVECPSCSIDGKFHFKENELFFEESGPDNMAKDVDINIKCIVEEGRSSMKGIDLISQERQRQIEKEGWTAEHDRQHIGDELVFAAICYALPFEFKAEGVETFWPWNKECYKPTPNDRIRELRKAGALIAAEIDRIVLENERGCHICGKSPSVFCEGCNEFACDEHFTEALCDDCMARVEIMSEVERKAIDRECIEALERGERL